MVEGGVGERRDDRRFGRDDELLQESCFTSFFSLKISEYKCSNSAARAGSGVATDVGVDIAATEEAETSLILSAISANLSRVVPSGAESSTMRTLGGNL